MKSEPLNIQTKLEIIEPKVAIGLSTVLGVTTAFAAFLTAVIAFLHDSSSPGGVAAIGTAAVAVYKVIDSRTAQKLAITPASPPRMVAHPLGTAANDAKAGEAVKLYLDGKSLAERISSMAGEAVSEAARPRDYSSTTPTAGEGTIHTDPAEKVPAYPGNPDEEDEADSDDDLDDSDVSEQMAEFKPTIAPGQEIPPDMDGQNDNIANSGATVLVAADGTVKTV